MRILVLLLGLVLGWGPLPAPAGASTPSPTLSLLVVGDTGKPPEAVPFLDPLLAVAAALEVEDRREPVDGLVLLGDNFYPDGLRERKFKERVRENVAAPFCHFLRLTSRGRGSLGDSCDRPLAERHPVPIHALLGNHDYGERESPLLQRKRIPEYVKNWEMPEGPFEVRELEGGVSLILLESHEWVRKDHADPLVEAIRRSRGPWRILAGHHPMVDTGKSSVPRYAKRMRGFLDRAGVPIHVYLAGHEHNLQAIERAGEQPPLHVVSGAGADLRTPEPGDPVRHYAAESYGFVRVDLAGDRLVVTFFEVSAARVTPLAPGRVGARFAVDLAGNVTKLPLEE